MSIITVYTVFKVSNMHFRKSKFGKTQYIIYSFVLENVKSKFGGYVAEHFESHFDKLAKIFPYLIFFCKHLQYMRLRQKLTVNRCTNGVAHNKSILSWAVIGSYREYAVFTMSCHSHQVFDMFYVMLQIKNNNYNHSYNHLKFKVHCSLLKILYLQTHKQTISQIKLKYFFKN